MMLSVILLSMLMILLSCLGLCWYLEMLDKLQKQTWRTVDFSLATYQEPLGHHENKANLSVFCRYYFYRYSFELARLVPLPYPPWRSSCYSDSLHNFLSPFLDLTRMSMSTVSFLAELDSGILSL